MRIGKEVLYLSRQSVIDVGLSMRETVDILERAHTLKGQGLVNMPVKPVVGNAAAGFTAAYFAEIPEMQAQGVKWLSGEPKNPARGMPPITGMMILNDWETRMPIAVMDCTYITGIRTAGVSGIGLRHFARKDSEVVGVLGLGLQGRTNLEAAVTECKNLKLVKAWAPREVTRKTYAEEMQDKYPFLEIRACETAEEAVRDADILLSSTPFGPYGAYQVIEKDWLKPGLTAVPVSQDWHFLPEAYKSFDKYFCDHKEAYLHMGAHQHVPYMPELSDYLNGRAPGRENDKEKIILITEGIAINDVSVARRIVDMAIEKGVGTVLPL